MKSKKRQPVYRTGALAIFTSFGAQAYADAAGTAASSDSDSLNEIVVTGVRQAMRDSIDVKKHDVPAASVLENEPPIACQYE